MTLALYGHPFSSYTQKALIALYENDTAFQFRSLEDKQAEAEWAALWPMRRFPLLLDDDRRIMEASVIVEYLDLRHPGRSPLLPTDRHAAIEVRFMDRFFDNYVMTPMQRIVFDHLRSEENRDSFGVAEARRALETAYGWLNEKMEGREWAAGEDFSLADCAAAPALFYADWTHPIDNALVNVKAYRQRLLARPSFARAVDEARPYRAYFPLGAPDRD
ncbi:glutathione S-transferase family protein [Methylocystis sp. L43]|jgi:glutathione S-transferase|uniref:glutathione S-transferase family protein n=1 Tax=unclassified Methylocystis TaxID=2625913 RepID=UPI0018C2CF9A|nr:MULTISPECIES: glutathione S-transferase family protein [unclassified Methylocystis]MBG0796377.1 glutathione S-transferase family protein [Methylocystis sp. L43]MBG0804308.1 glutathione S-transferase family protein [Methylocystis sp. H15]